MGRGVEGSRDRKAERVGGGHVERGGGEWGEEGERDREKSYFGFFFFSISALRWQAHVWG